MRVDAVLILALLLAAPAVSHADSNTVLEGHVFHEDGTPAAHAEIDAYSPSEIRKAFTDKTGHFTMFGLQNDVYTIDANAGNGRGIVFGAIVAPGETDFVIIPLSSFSCPALGRSMRDGSSYLINEHPSYAHLYCL